MKLLDNWVDILTYAWSIRFIVLAGILSGIEVYLQIFGSPVWMPLGVFAVLSAAVSCLALVSRILVQKNFKGE